MKLMKKLKCDKEALDIKVVDYFYNSYVIPHIKDNNKLYDLNLKRYQIWLTLFAWTMLSIPLMSLWSSINFCQFCYDNERKSDTKIISQPVETFSFYGSKQRIGD